jgi:hypothetical protein
MRSILISILCLGCASQSATPAPGVDGSVEPMPRRHDADADAGRDGIDGGQPGATGLAQATLTLP